MAVHILNRLRWKSELKIPKAVPRQFLSTVKSTLGQKVVSNILIPKTIHVYDIHVDMYILISSKSNKPNPIIDIISPANMNLILCPSLSAIDPINGNITT